MRGENKVLVFWFVSLACLITTATIHCLTWFNKGIILDIFDQRSDDIWKAYNLQILQAEWILGLYIVIYLYQVVWMFYCLVPFCFKTQYGWLYRTVPITSTTDLTLFTFALALELGWLALWHLGSPYSHYAPILQGFSGVLLYLTLAVTIRHTFDFQPHLIIEKLLWVLWGASGIVHNGLAAYATLSTVVTVYNILGILLQEGILNTDLASYIFLGFVLIYAIGWLAFDLLRGKLRTALIFSPYVILMLVLAPMVASRDTHAVPLIIAAVFLGFIMILLVVKVATAIGFVRRDHQRNNLQLQESQADNDGVDMGPLSVDENQWKSSS